jgi:hypothetical protein
MALPMGGERGCAVNPRIPPLGYIPSAVRFGASSMFVIDETSHATGINYAGNHAKSIKFPSAMLK